MAEYRMCSSKTGSWLLFAWLILNLFAVDPVNGYQQAGGSVKTIPAPEGAKPVRALQDAKGNVALVADSESGPVCFQSADYGESFSKPIRLVDEDGNRNFVVIH
jgi:hypothetical protein